MLLAAYGADNFVAVAPTLQQALLICTVPFTPCPFNEKALLDTYALLPQAYGAKNYAAVGVTLQRALLICLAALAALLPLWLAMEPLLLAMGGSESICG